jgi:hypothetical protein
MSVDFRRVHALLPLSPVPTEAEIDSVVNNQEVSVVISSTYNANVIELEMHGKKLMFNATDLCNAVNQMAAISTKQRRLF